MDLKQDIIELYKKTATQLPEDIVLPKVKVKQVGKSAEGVPFVVGKDRWIVGENPAVLFSSFESQQNEVMEKTANILAKLQEANEKDQIGLVENGQLWKIISKLLLYIKKLLVECKSEDQSSSLILNQHQ